MSCVFFKDYILKINYGMEPGIKIGFYRESVFVVYGYRRFGECY